MLQTRDMARLPVECPANQRLRPSMSNLLPGEVTRANHEAITPAQALLLLEVQAWQVLERTVLPVVRTAALPRLCLLKVRQQQESPPSRLLEALERMVLPMVRTAAPPRLCLKLRQQVSLLSHL